MVLLMVLSHIASQICFDGLYWYKYVEWPFLWQMYPSWLGWGPVNPVIFTATSCLHFPSKTIIVWRECQLYIHQPYFELSAGDWLPHTCPVKLDTTWKSIILTLVKFASRYLHFEICYIFMRHSLSLNSALLQGIRPQSEREKCSNNLLPYQTM